MNYRIQVATLARFGKDLATHVGTVTCVGQKQIVEETLEACKMKAPKIVVDEDGYYGRVYEAAKALINLVGAERVFEVGLRSATCMEQHLIALEACLKAGIRRTSNVYGAERLGTTPVGTMGHEHVQRYGDDESAFRAMKDRRPHRSSFLLDTYDTMLSGIPAAFRVMAEASEERDSIRYDSGGKLAQFVYAVTEAKTRGLRPVHIVEDGLDLEQTRQFEKVREALGVPAEDVHYGYGGHLVATPSMGFTRDQVSAAYKLCQTGPWPTMKFSNDRGKESLPGRPVVFRRTSGTGPFGIVGQEGEKCPEGYRMETGAAEAREFLDTDSEVCLSPATKALHARCAERADRLRLFRNT